MWKEEELGLEQLACLLQEVMNRLSGAEEQAASVVGMLRP